MVIGPFSGSPVNAARYPAYDQVVAIPGVKVVLHVEIGGADRFRRSPKSGPLVTIEVRLNCVCAPERLSVGPARQGVASGGIDRVGKLGLRGIDEVEPADLIAVDSGNQSPCRVGYRLRAPTANRRETRSGRDSRNPRLPRPTGFHATEPREPAEGAVGTPPARGAAILRRVRLSPWRSGGLRNHAAGRGRAGLVMMLMTPLTALAPHTVPPGPRMTSMRSMSPAAYRGGPNRRRRNVAV